VPQVLAQSGNLGGRVRRGIEPGQRGGAVRLEIRFVVFGGQFGRHGEDYSFCRAGSAYRLRHDGNAPRRARELCRSWGRIYLKEK